MRTLIYFMSAFCILIFLVSCNLKRKNPKFDENLIQIIAEHPIYSENSDVSPLYVFTTFFVQGDNNKILLLDPRELEEIYIENYSSWKYKKFVQRALNQELIIKANNKGKVFELDVEVTDNYINNVLLDFCKIYCDGTEENDRFLLKIDVQDDQLPSILYYFFINNYLTWFDDPSGLYTISKTSRFTNHYFKGN